MSENDLKYMSSKLYGTEVNCRMEYEGLYQRSGGVNGFKVVLLCVI